MASNFQPRPQHCSSDQKQSLVPEAPTVWMTTSLSLLSRQPNVSHHPLLHLVEAVSHVLRPLAACGRVVPSNLDIPHTSMSLCQPAPLRIQTATSVHTSGSITNVSSSIVRFRPSHNQLTPHGDEVLQTQGRWHSTPQCLPRSKTKTPNSAMFSIHPSFFFSGLHLFISFWSFFLPPTRQFSSVTSRTSRQIFSDVLLDVCDPAQLVCHFCTKYVYMDEMDQLRRCPEFYRNDK